MNNYRIVFSPRAQQRLEEIADYLYQQQLSNQFVLDYLQRFEDWLVRVLKVSKISFQADSTSNLSSQYE